MKFAPNRKFTIAVGEMEMPLSKFTRKAVEAHEAKKKREAETVEIVAPKIESNTVAGPLAIVPRKKERKTFTVLSSAQIEAMPPNNSAWMCRTLGMRLGGASLVAAEPKVAKSTMLRQICHCAASGEDFFGKPLHRTKCIFLDLEGHRLQTIDHFRLLNGGKRIQDPNLPDDPEATIVVGAFINANVMVGFVQDTDDAIERLTHLIEDHPDVGLIVIDTMGDFFGEKLHDVKDYTDSKKALARINKIARANPHLHIVVTTHANKLQRPGVTQNILGSHAHGGAFDANIILQKEGSGRNAPRFITTDCRDGETNLDKTQLTFDSERCTLSLGKPVAETNVVDRETTAQRVKSDIIAFVEKSPCATETTIEKEIHADTNVFRKAFKELRISNVLTRTGKGVSGNPYLYEYSPLPETRVEAVTWP